MNDLLLILIVAGIAWMFWRAFSSKPTPVAQPDKPTPKEDPQVRHLRTALEFAKTQHKVLTKKTTRTGCLATGAWSREGRRP